MDMELGTVATFMSARSLVYFLLTRLCLGRAMAAITRGERDVLAGLGMRKPEVKQLLHQGHSAWYGLGTVPGVNYTSPAVTLLTPAEAALRFSAA